MYYIIRERDSIVALQQPLRSTIKRRLLLVQLPQIRLIYIFDGTFTYLSPSIYPNLQRRTQENPQNASMKKGLSVLSTKIK